jgi:hypothetical protein
MKLIKYVQNYEFNAVIIHTLNYAMSSTHRSTVLLTLTVTLEIITSSDRRSINCNNRNVFQTK